MSAKDEGAAPSELPPFSSFEELQEEHLKLSEEHEQELERGGELPSAPILTFIKRGVATGVLLGNARERRSAQSLLDYWAATLIEKNAGRLEPATLRRFDEAQADKWAPDLSDKPCPYVGLDAFDEKTAPYFFGREKFVEQLFELVMKNPLVVVTGPSGSGKSSVVSAGLFNRLSSAGLLGIRKWSFRQIVPGTQPRFPKDLNSNTPTLLFIDQFEEVFAGEELDELGEAFLADIRAAAQKAGSKLRIVLTMRSDFIAFLQKSKNTFYEEACVEPLPPLSAAELRDAIEKPAALVGLVYAPGVVELLVSELLGEPAALPLLQFTLSRLWELKRRNRVSLEIYKQVGGGRQALEQHATAVYDRLIPEQQLTAKRILLRLGRPRAGYGVVGVKRLRTVGIEMMRNRVKRLELLAMGEDPGRIAAVLATLVREKLLRETGAKDEPVEEHQIEIAHEALVRNWTLFTDWLEADRAELERRRRWESLLEEWRRINYAKSGLLDEAQLSELNRWLENPAAIEVGYDQQLKQLAAESEANLKAQKEARELEQQRQLIEAKALAQAERTVAEAKAAELEGAKALAQAERVAQRRLLRGLAGVLVLSAVAVICAVLAVRSSQKAKALAQVESAHRQRASQSANEAMQQLEIANQQRQLAESYSRRAQAYSAFAFAMVEKDKDYRRALGIIYHQFVKDPSFDTRSGIFGFLAAEQGTSDVQPPRPAAKGPYVDGLLSPDGKYIYALSASGELLIWRSDGRFIRTVDRSQDPKSPSKAPIDKVSFAADSSELAIYSRKDTALDRRSITGENRDNLLSLAGSKGHSAGLSAVSYGLDGQTILTGSLDHTAILWDRKTGQPIAKLADAQQTAPIVALVLSPDSKRALLIDAGGAGHLWYLSASCQSRSDMPAGDLTGGLFSGDGKLLYTYAKNGTVRAYTLKEVKGENCPSLTLLDDPAENRQDHPILDVRPSGDGQRLLIFSADFVRELNAGQLDAGKTPDRRCDGKLQRLDISDKTGTILIATAKKQICVFTRDKKEFSWPRRNSLSDLVAIRLSPTGSGVFTFTAGGKPKLWNEDGTPGSLASPLPKLAGHTDGVESGRFSHDGGLLATVSGRYARFWRRTADERWNFEGSLVHDYAVWSVVFSPDDQELLTTAWEPNLRVLPTAADCLADSVKCLTRYAPKGIPTQLWKPIEGQFSADGKSVLASYADGKVLSWPLSKQAVSTSNTVLDSSTMVHLAVDGSALYSMNLDGGTVNILNLDGTPKGPPLKHGKPLAQVEYCPKKEQWVTVSSDGEVILWPSKNQAAQRRFRIGGWPRVFEISESCDNILSIADSQVARLWDGNGTLRHELHGQWLTNPLHGAVSPSGLLVAIYQPDATLELWDGRNGKRWATFTAHSQRISSAVFDPKEQWLLTTSADGTARLWPTTDKLLRASIEGAGPEPLSDEVLSKYHLDSQSLSPP